MDSKPKLIFVYNADSGIANLLKDCLHKLISPKTYPCKLCDLTYGIFSERNRWKKFRKTIEAEMVFLHADEFNNQYSSKFLPNYELPIVLMQNAYDLDVFIDKKAMDECDGLNEFMSLVERQLDKVKPS